MSDDEDERTPRLGRRGVLRAVGAGTMATALAGRAGAQDGGGGDGRPDFGGWLDGIDGGYRDARGEDSVTVLVGAQGNGGAYAYAPAGLWVDPGTTVRWRWTGEGAAHNVVADSGPAALDSGDPVDTTGVQYEHTFEEGGVTTYYCDPHLSLGMKGGVAVGDDVPTVAAEPPAADTGPGYWQRPEAFVASLVFGLLGLAAAVTLGAETYSYVRAQGGVRGPKPAESGGVTEEATPPEPETELDHDSYDPTGTAALIIVYFLVLVVMWVFMYFVEFLGNGPTVIG